MLWTWRNVSIRVCPERYPCQSRRLAPGGSLRRPDQRLGGVDRQAGGERLQRLHVGVAGGRDHDAVGQQQHDLARRAHAPTD